MIKRYLYSLSFAALLCMMLLGTYSCKKDDDNGGKTPDPVESDFFIDVDFLPQSETNGEVAPRLMANFNNEMVMIELRRPSSSSAPMETLLLLSPDNESLMLCGNDSLMVCAAYDLPTQTPSSDVLLVTLMDANTMLLTKCFMDWNTNTLTESDMMALSLDGISKNRGKGDDIDGEIRSFFFNNFVKPLADKFEQVESFCDIFGGYGGTVFSLIKTTITTGLTTILYSDDPQEFYDHMEYPVTMWATPVAQTGVLNLFEQDYSEMASKILAATGWFTDGGHGEVDDYEGTGGNDFPYTSLYLQALDLTAVSSSAIPEPIFLVDLNVSNVTENSAFLKGSYRFGSNSSITPVEMGYIIKVIGGPEHTEFDMYFNGITVSGLHKATKYMAYAYVKSIMGDKVLSPGVAFWTLGFEAFPNSLAFPAEGDTKNVALSYSEEDITSWEITGSPSWCSITKDDLGLLAVTVRETTEARSGVITITAHSNAFGTITEDITVTQNGANSWDGTSWYFTGTVTTHSTVDGSSSSDAFGFTLSINNVSNEDITFDFAQVLSSAANGYSDNYVVDGDGKLVYSASASYSGDWGNNQITSRVTFARTGANTATADFHYRETVSTYGVITASGLLQGTLIDAKEIKDYETAINLKTPVFQNRF